MKGAKELTPGPATDRIKDLLANVRRKKAHKAQKGN
jgi:hypothetical protein